MSQRTMGLLLVAVVALGAMTGVAAAESGLGVTVDDTGEQPTVNVTHNDTAVENATVNVSVVDATNESYNGTGEYETDANGTVELDVPDENVTIDVTASFENETASTTADLTAADGAEGDQPFGQLVREFIEDLDDREGGIGDAVSDWVTENNPGNAPDHAGGGQDNAGNASDTPGNAPDDAGQGNNGEQGPPDHAGQGNNGGDATDDEDDEDDDEANGNNGNGNGNGNGQA